MILTVSLTLVCPGAGHPVLSCLLRFILFLYRINLFSYIFLMFPSFRLGSILTVPPTSVFVSLKLCSFFSLLRHCFSSQDWPFIPILSRSFHPPHLHIPASLSPLVPPLLRFCSRLRLSFSYYSTTPLLAGHDDPLPLLRRHTTLLLCAVSPQSSSKPIL